MNSGSPFFSEILRTTSSLRPGASASVSMSLTKPYLYSVATKFSMVSVSEFIIGQVLSVKETRASAARCQTAAKTWQPQILGCEFCIRKVATTKPEILELFKFSQREQNSFHGTNRKNFDRRKIFRAKYGG